MTRLEQLEALWAWLNEDGCSDIDGDDLQEKAVGLGLIKVEPYDTAKHGDELANEYGFEPGDDCYVVVEP